MNQPNSLESGSTSTPECVDTAASRGNGGVIGGVILIAIGTAFLLDRMDLLPARPWSFWPVVPILIGSWMTLSARNWETRKSGLIVLGIGFWVWASENRWGDLSWRTSWPLLLIGFGALSVFEALLGLGKRPRRDGRDEERKQS